MNDKITYRWLDSSGSDADWRRVEAVLEFRGWMSLNRLTSRVLIAEDESGTLAGFFIFQLVPMAGPVWVHPSVLGTGVADEMARQMWEMLITGEARGWLASAETAHGERLCEKFRMQKVEYPMYITVGVERKS